MLMILLVTASLHKDSWCYTSRSVQDSEYISHKALLFRVFILSSRGVYLLLSQISLKYNDRNFTVSVIKIYGYDTKIQL